MPQIPNPPELILLKTVWAHGPLPVRRLHDLSVDQLAWSFSSTRKTISRMCDKGFLTGETEGGPALIRAKTSKTAVLAYMTRDFMHRVLEIDGKLPAKMFSSSKALSDDELEELEGLL